MKDNGKTSGRSVEDNLARTIANGIIGLQLQASKTLGRWERSWGRQRRKLFFLVFFGLVGGYCAYILGDALFGKGRPAPYPSITGGSHQPLAIPAAKETGGATDSMAYPTEKNNNQ